MTPRELITKVENEDLSKDQLLQIASELGVDVDKRNGPASIRSAIIDKAEDLEVAFPDSDVFGSEVEPTGETHTGGNDEPEAGNLTPPKDDSPQAADLEKRRDEGRADTSGVEAPKQQGTFTPNVETQAADKSRAERQSESYQKPKGRTLVNTTNGRRFPWSAALANRKDMKEV